MNKISTEKKIVIVVLLLLIIGFFAAITNGIGQSNQYKLARKEFEENTRQKILNFRPGDCTIVPSAWLKDLDLDTTYNITMSMYDSRICKY